MTAWSTTLPMVNGWYRWRKHQSAPEKTVFVWQHSRGRMACEDPNEKYMAVEAVSIKGAWFGPVDEPSPTPAQ